MSYAHQIHVLRSGPELAPLLEHSEVLHWCLCATGQAFSPDPLPPPAIFDDLNLVEPLGGNLLHLILRPSLKQLDLDTGASITPSQIQISMLERLLSEACPSGKAWDEALKIRDLFGLRAVDYLVNIDVLGGQPLEQSVSDEPIKPKNFRGIILSLTKKDMLKSDLIYGLIKARDFAGFDLFPGINSRNPSELRITLLRHFDLLNQLRNQTA